mmetsp:Transcript_17165/g.28515  ORF Transcript_17165/g.28515 Transcript_17165/m.28515 type:complete len:266 (+) Transcript_17165:66-863(+)|eukprot:CAMPEP_0119013334 /NCGR_PEP_ID=MMETSP1176-20130426/8386_1 /TAXON_ID=265551 /ORGANISM="Synedropsis recta cf, Strain CCMP1620" /LENGTH=265 /DNA_ID=CAMNT_0006966421 /DNA_START=56 /DNA_END=853 /DNA_ORIENTATION=+
MSRVQGTVKWFSNKKGYGFVEPTSEDDSTQEDVFVHQSSVLSDGYRTLVEGWIVEFEIVNDENGKLKADNVTAPGGGPCTGPRRQRTREKKPDGEANGGGGGGTKKNGSKKPAVAPWHDSVTDEVKESLTTKGIKHTTGTVDVSTGKQRIKLGTGGYVSMAHGDGILAEGSFESDESGSVTFTWAHIIKFADGAWSGSSADGLITTLSLSDDATIAVGAEETPETLWGEGKPDPKDALEAEGFQMRRVVLTPKVRSSKPIVVEDA